MADFQTSTHRSRWIFSPQDLVAKHETANQRAAKMLEQYGTTRLEVNVDGSLSYPEPMHDQRENERQSASKPLSCEEEQHMRVFYEQKIQEVCGAFMFPHKIQGTAIIYFKRFYLQWSVMEHHPKHIMLTCIYASCKVEENHVSAEELGKGIQQDHKMILNNEMLVLQSLGFDLIVYAPYRPIEGFVADMEEFCQSRIDEPSKFKDLIETAKSEVDKIMLTDAPLLFPPGQLALAALCRSNEVHRVLDFESYLESIFNRQCASHSTLELTESLKAVDVLVEKLKIPTAKDMRHIDRKLKNCLDPSSVEEYFLSTINKSRIFLSPLKFLLLEVLCNFCAEAKSGKSALSTNLNEPEARPKERRQEYKYCPKLKMRLRQQLAVGFYAFWWSVQTFYSKNFII